MHSKEINMSKKFDVAGPAYSVVKGGKVPLTNRQKYTIAEALEAFRREDVDPLQVKELYERFRGMVKNLPGCAELTDADINHLFISAYFEGRSDAGDDQSGRAIDSEFSVDAAVDFLVKTLESIPRRYVLKITLPSLPSWGNFRFKLLGDNEAFLCGTASAEPKENVNKLAYLFSNSLSPSASDRVWIEIGYEGYVSPYTTTPAAALAASFSKQVSFLFEYLGLAQEVSSSQKSTLIAEPISAEFGSGVELEFPSGLASHLGGLGIKKSFLEVYETSGADSLLGGEMRPCRTDGERLERFEVAIKKIHDFLCRSTSSGFASITSAIEWLQDSRLNDDQTLAYLAACIGFEALLGDTDGKLMNEMSQRLSDRYAYMLGKDVDDRKRLGAEFRRVLLLRGELVHARKRRLDAKDFGQLRSVQSMLEKAIHHEMRASFSF